MFGSLRVDEDAEIEGLDLSEHSESAYGLAGGGTLAPEVFTQGWGARDDTGSAAPPRRASSPP